MQALKSYYLGVLLKLFRDSYIFFLKYPLQNLAIVCENGIYIVSKFNLFYMYFIKREDLEIVKIEKMKFLNQVEVCFVIKTKNKILLKCFESIYKKEDLEKLKNWYENKL